MNYPIFFDEIEKIKVYDELAHFLGVGDGLFEYSYLDMVKIAGHSCITVAGGYLYALVGLKELYKHNIPKRGDIKVEIKNGIDDGNTGVIATVLSNITGATTNSGFGGMMGKFNRRGLLFFNANIKCEICLTRLDINKTVCLNYNPQNIVNTSSIFDNAFGKNSTENGKKEFPKLFQEAVKKVLTNKDKVVEICNR